MSETQLPSGWALAMIPQLVSADGEFSDGDWVESKDQDPNGDVRLIQLADVGDGEYTSKSSRFLTRAKADELRCTFLRTGDILVARMPDPLGRACIFPGDPKLAVTVVDVCVVRPGSLGVDSHWLMWAINSPQFRNEVAALQKGSTRKRISRGNLATIHLPVPPVAEQRRIVAALEEHLSDLDAAVAGLERARANIELFKNVTLDAFFGDAVSAASPRRALSEVSASTMIGLDRGREHQTRDGVGAPYVKMGDVTRDGRVLFEDIVYVRVSPDESTRYSLQEGDLLFNTRNSVELVGKTGLVRRPPTGAVFNNNLMRIRPKPEVVPAFLAWQMVSPSFRRRLDRIKRATTNVAAIYAKDLLPLEVLVPPISDQRATVADIERRLASAEHAAAEIDVQLARAARLRQSILKRAFEGKLVPQESTDEPASALLERIRKSDDQPTRRGKREHAPRS